MNTHTHKHPLSLRAAQYKHAQVGQRGGGWVGVGTKAYLHIINETIHMFVLAAERRVTKFLVDLCKHACGCDVK